MDNRLPPRYAFRLEDLRVWHVVRVSCRICRHRADIISAALTRAGRAAPVWSTSRGGFAAGIAGREARRRWRWNCGRGIESGPMPGSAGSPGGQAAYAPAYALMIYAPADNRYLRFRVY